jgi:hypothetical protein
MGNVDFEKQLNKYGEEIEKDMSLSKIKVWSKIEEGLDQKQNNLLSNITMKKIIKILAIPVVLILVGAIGMWGYEFVAYDPGMMGVVDQGEDDSQVKIGSVYESEESESVGSLDKDSSTTITEGSPQEDSQLEEKDRAKEKYGVLDLIVEDIDKTVSEVQSLISEYKAYTDEFIVESDYAEFDIKVPVDQFENLYADLRALGLEVEYERVNSVDKQKEINVIDSAIENINEQIEALREELENTEDRVKIESIENEIVRLESKKEGLTTDLSQLTKDTEVSTIILTLSKNEAESLLGDLKETLNRFKNIGVFWVKALLWLITGIVFVAPVVAVVLLAKKIVREKDNN